MHRQFRFKAGDKLMIRPDDPSPFAGLEARLEGVEPHNRDVAVLDRYIVVFQWGEKHSLYDAQLVDVCADEPGANRPQLLTNDITRML